MCGLVEEKESLGVDLSFHKMCQAQCLSLPANQDKTLISCTSFSDLHGIHYDEEEYPLKMQESPQLNDICYKSDMSHYVSS